MILFFASVPTTFPRTIVANQETPPLEASELSDISRNEIIRKVRLARLFSLLSIAAHCTGISTLTLMAWLTGQFLLLFAPAASVVAIPLFGCAFWLAGRQKIVTGSWILALSNLVVISLYYWTLGMAVHLSLAYFIPIGLALVLLGRGAVAFLTLSSSVFCAVLYLGQYQLKFYQPPVNLSQDIYALPNIALFVVILPLITLLLFVPSQNLASTLRAFQNQTGRLQQVLTALERRQEISQVSSGQVVALANKLSATSIRQANGNQEQVVAVSQIQASTEELTKTAAHIDELTEVAKQAVQQVSANSTDIEETTGHAVKYGEQGIEAVQQNLAVSQEVAQLYQTLLDNLTELNNKNSNMRVILQLLSTITTQTHLLALNASIEAAGAGLYGDRFRIVAHEVKQLAGNSAQANKDIVTIIQEIEQSTVNALDSVARGYSKAQTMTQVADQTGQVIGALQAIAENSQQQAVVIRQTAQEVKQIVETVKLATTQQLIVTSQVSQALQNLGTAAELTSENSVEVKTVAGHLENVANKLNINLVQS